MAQVYIWRDTRSPAQQRAEQAAVDTAVFFSLEDDTDDPARDALAYWKDHQEMIIGHNDSTNDPRFVVGVRKLLDLGWIRIAPETIEHRNDGL